MVPRPNAGGLSAASRRRNSLQQSAAQHTQQRAHRIARQAPRQLLGHRSQQPKRSSIHPSQQTRCALRAAQARPQRLRKRHKKINAGKKMSSVASIAPGKLPNR